MEHQAATQASATFNLGRYFCHRAELADRIIDERGTARDWFGLVLGESFLSEVQKAGSAALYDESLRYFETASKQFGTEKIRGVTISELAAEYIDQIKNVSIGKMARRQRRRGPGRSEVCAQRLPWKSRRAGILGLLVPALHARGPS